MGAGNFFPHIGGVEYRMVYVGCPIEENEGNFQDAIEDWANNLYENVLASLPPAFYGVRYDSLKWQGDMNVWAENGVTQVCVKNLETNGLALVVMPVIDNETQEPAHPELVDEQVPYIFRLMTEYLEGYELRTRTGPWTSAIFDTKDIDRG